MNPYPIVQALSWSLRCRTLGRPQDVDTEGVAGDSDPRLYEKPGRPGLDARTSDFEGSHHPVRPHGRECPFFGYNDVQDGFEVPWSVRRMRQ